MYFDIVIIIILFFGLLTGLKNGIFTEIISIFGFVINIIIAKIYTPVVLKFFKRADTFFGNNYLITYIVTFLAVYLIISMILCFVKKAFSAQKMGFLNRFLGGLLGLLKGLIAATIIIFIYVYASTFSKTLENYSTGSKSIEIFYEVLPNVENYIPNIFLDKLNKESTKKFIEKNINTIL